MSEDKVILTKEEYQQLLDNNERLKDAEKRANAANKAKSDFLSSMSHEIRTPMNSVLGMNELIRMTLADASLSIADKIGRVIGYSDGIQHSGEMLLYVINDILDISKIESGKFEIRPAPYRFKKLLEDMIPLFTINAEGKSLLFTSETDEDLPGYVEGDEVRIRQIISNIVNNAIKYTKEGSVSLTITGRKTEEGVIYDIAVKDTGIGIKQENLSHLFDSFERVDSAETHYIEGTGLGLAIVKSLLDLMGGSIEVESVYGEGSLFTAHIPQKVLSDERIRDYRPATGPEMSESRHHFFTGRQILVVDDNLTNLTVARSFLEQMKCEAETITSGREALKVIGERHFDIIFLDHMMPEMSGVKVLKEIRLHPEKYEVNRETPFIVMTANAVAGAKEQYINEFGFDGYIAKPFRFAELDRLMSTYMEGEDAKSAAAPMTPPVGAGGPPPGAKGEVWDIDYKAGIDTCGDQDTYDVVADTYLEIQAENMEKLAGCLKSDDWENYRIIVHALKSSSFTIGAKNFGGFSMTVENAAKELSEGKDIEKNLGYLRGSYHPYTAAYAAVCENLRKHRAGRQN
ncbi:MAG: response regulator [Lachnospiraceae bacterium]|nr:response regulator [Lachnospiraceae bacterium]